MLLDGSDEFAILGTSPVALASPVLVLGHARLVNSGVGSLILYDSGTGLAVKLIDSVVEGGWWGDGRRDHLCQRCLVTRLHLRWYDFRGCLLQ